MVPKNGCHGGGDQSRNGCEGAVDLGNIGAARADSSLGHAPSARWEFDESVTRCFDDMLRRSIPQHDVMRRAVLDLAVAHRVAKTDIVDLGCARGEAMAPLVDRFGATNGFVGIETSTPMLEECRRRFAGMIERGVVRIDDLDLREAYPSVRASVTLAVLTIQFVPIDYRLRVLRDAFRSTVPGGALLMVEKVLATTADIQKTFVETYHSMKIESGYGADEVERKRLALEGVLVPCSARWNEEMLRAAGFSDVDCFWRWMNFAGWLAIKG